jgi:hypothetical protein
MYKQQATVADKTVTRVPQNPHHRAEVKYCYLSSGTYRMESPVPSYLETSNSKDIKLVQKQIIAIHN